MRRTLLLVGALTLAACNHGDSGSSATAFAPLVSDLIRNQTTETGAPIEVNGQTFSFPTSADAFDDVLPPDTGPVVH